MKSGSSCCNEGSEIIKKLKIKDKNKKHYPYKKEIKIGGMTCTKCAQIIENNFNKLGYIYAKIDFDNEEGLCQKVYNTNIVIFVIVNYHLINFFYNYTKNKL